MLVPDERPTWSSSTKLLVSMLMLGMLVYILAQFSEIIAPLILASILAFLLNPLANRIEGRFHLPRWLATLLIYLVLLGVLATVPAIVIPLLIDRLTSFTLAFEGILLSIEGFLSNEIIIGETRIDGAQIVSQILEPLRGLIEPFFGQTLGLAFSLITSFAWSIFVIVVSFYMVKDRRQLIGWLANLPPPAFRRDFERLREEINLIWSAFFRGQLILASLVSVIFILWGTIVGLPFSLAMGMLAGLLEFVPSLGHTIWLIIAGLLAYFSGSTWLPLPNWAFTLLVIVIHQIFASFDINFLIPRIIGRRVRLHPLWIIVGILVGASLAGVLGVVLAAPVIATGRVFARYVLASLYDQDPFNREDAKEPVYETLRESR